MKSTYSVSISLLVRAILLSTMVFLPEKLMAKQGLPEETHVTEGLIAISMADTVRTICPSIDARLITAFIYLNSLKEHALDLGYTVEEIKAFINDKNEKERLIEIAGARLSTLGAITESANSYCAVGLSEIKAGSDIGKLLKAN